MNSWIARPTTKLFISLNKGTISGEQIAPEYIAFDLKHRYLTESPPATNNEFIYDNTGVGQDSHCHDQLRSPTIDRANFKCITNEIVIYTDVTAMCAIVFINLTILLPLLLQNWVSDRSNTQWHC